MLRVAITLLAKLTQALADHSRCHKEAFASDRAHVDEILELFDAGFVSLVITGGIKTFGEDYHQEEVLEILRYLQQRRFGWVGS